MTIPDTARGFTDEAVRQGARLARLELPTARESGLAAALDEMYREIDRLDDLPLVETPPATAFDPRWE